VPRYVDLRRVRHFVVLAELLNFRRAAEKLNMAQPPLSVSIQKFEAELGTPLFSRGPGGVALTSNGRAALEDAKRLLAYSDLFAENIGSRNQGESGELQIGFVGSTTYGMLQKLIPAFRSENPRVELVLRESTSSSIVLQVEEEQFDIGLVRTPLLQNTSVTLMQLEQDELVAALGVGNPLGTKKRLRLADLSGESFVMYRKAEGAGLYGVATLACQESGFFPRITQEALQIQTVLSLVESGLGIALVPSIMQRFASKKIVYRKLVHLPEIARTGLGLVYRHGLEGGAARRFRLLAAREYALGP
jgi:DNA-binding transcriptional LysR family regulator